MFEDFEDDGGGADRRKRMGVSMAVSAVVFVAAAVGLTTAVAVQHGVLGPRERDVDVEFAALDDLVPEPELEPVPAVEDVATTERPAARRRDLRPPRSIPRERPQEREGQLAAATDTGPVDGFLEGEDAPPEPGPSLDQPPPAPPSVVTEPAPAPPAQERDGITRPRWVSGCRAPTIPEALHGQAATIRVEIRMLIGIDGRVLRAEMTESHALVPDELILACAREQVFAPAELSDGTPVPYPFRRRFVFRPASA